MVGGKAGPTERRLHAELVRRGVQGARFSRVRPDYYSFPLEKRMSLLCAPSVFHLCVFHPSPPVPHTKVAGLLFEQWDGSLQTSRIDPALCVRVGTGREQRPSRVRPARNSVLNAGWFEGRDLSLCVNGTNHRVHSLSLSLRVPTHRGPPPALNSSRCKSILLENENAPANVTDCSDPTCPRYLLVIVQYKSTLDVRTKLRDWAVKLSRGK